MKKLLIIAIASLVSIICLGQSDTLTKQGICEQDSFNSNTVPVKFKSGFDSSAMLLTWNKSGHLISSYISYSDSTFSKPKVIFWEDGSISLENCDSLSAIKILISDLKEANKRDADMWKFVGTAVTFTNSIPDYYKLSKNNKAWPAYYAQLKKLGYKIERK